jgi:hypothetical protein
LAAAGVLDCSLRDVVSVPLAIFDSMGGCEPVAAFIIDEALQQARGTKTRKRLEIAIEGLREAVGLCKEGGKPEFLTPLGKLADELSRALEGCDQAFATKRHGRDRDHALLLECHSFLQAELGRAVTYATLANLVNAGYEADGDPPTDPADEEQVGKNLTNFKNNNPLWPLYTSR